MNLEPLQRDQVAGRDAHNMRSGYISKSVDPDLIKDNLDLYMPEARPQIPSHQPPRPDKTGKLRQPRKIRDDARVACSMVMTLPEELGLDQLDEWVEASMAWWHQLPGQADYAVLHLDEPGARPHIHAIRIPIDEAGHLSYERDFGGHSERLDALHLEYAAALAPLGVAMSPEAERKRRRRRRKDDPDAPAQDIPVPTVATRGELLQEVDRLTGQVTAAEARADTAESALIEVARALPGPYAIPVPAPPGQAAAVKDEEPESHWGAGEQPQVEAKPAGRRHLLLPAGWFVRLRERLENLVQLRAGLRRRFSHLFADDLVRESIDNVARLNRAAEKSISAREAAEFVPKRPGPAESVPLTSAPADNVPMDDSGAENDHTAPESSENDHNDPGPAGFSP